MTLIDVYLDLQDKYERKFGHKTIVLMQVGGFFEIYGVVNDTTKRGKIYEIADITNLSVSKKCSKTAPVSMKNPLMAGFPNHSFEKWQDILLKYNYTIIKIEQEANGVKDPARSVTEIISQGVNVHSKHFSNNMISVYLEQFKDHKTKQPLLQIGVSTIDITTGETTVYETHSNIDDYLYSLDEVFRIIQITNPCEILIHTVNIDMTQEALIKYLELDNYQVHFDMYSETNILKNTYKTELLSKVFPNHGILTPVEFINMETLPFALISYMYLLEFTYEHNENIIKKLIKPTIVDTSKYLILSHDSINQLNLIRNSRFELKGKIQSLWDVLDYTNTPMGRRYLKHQLLNPILDVGELNARYTMIERLMANKKFTTVRQSLKNIVDIERIHRKMAMGIMQPFHFLNLDISYSNILQLFTQIQKHKLNGFLDDSFNDSLINTFKEFIASYTDHFRLEHMGSVSNNNITTAIFKQGLYPHIDVVLHKIEFYKAFFPAFKEHLCKVVHDTLKKPVKNYISVKYNDRDGHYLYTTPARANVIKGILEGMSSVQFEVDNTIITIETSNILFKSTSSGVKISNAQMRNHSQILSGLYAKVARLSQQEFQNITTTYYETYETELKIIVKCIGYLDFISNLAYVSHKNGYFRPTIELTDKSFVKATALRHPIIELIHDTVEYVPNDIHLGTDNQDGILLYGVNAVGKSSLMKSVGISIIMAQMGSYVPATAFTYSPYKHIFTRISNNDNIFKGQSTFAVEMSELRSILTRSNMNSLILGDELCSGTETTSGLSIVTAGVIRLSDKGSSFIFATHLHKLSSMPELEPYSTVHNYHMETIFDKAKHTLIYNRKLKHGSGNAIYGLEVARAMNLDTEFIQMADTIRRRLMGKSQQIVNDKTSVYNSKIIINACSICKKPTEEVHHIQEQETADMDGMIGHYHKNRRSNLVQLCSECHHNVHHGTLQINGFIDTLDGTTLDYEYISTSKVQRRRKYNLAQIDNIKELYTLYSNYSTVKAKMSTDSKSNISVATIKKIILGTY